MSRLGWDRLRARDRGRDGEPASPYGSDRRSVVRVLRALRELAPTPVPTRWTRGKHGDWLVRGPLGLTGDVDVEKRSGGTSRVTIERLLWSGDGVALYRVRRF